MLLDQYINWLFQRKTLADSFTESFTIYSKTESFRKEILLLCVAMCCNGSAVGLFGTIFIDWAKTDKICYSILTRSLNCLQSWCSSGSKMHALKYHQTLAIYLVLVMEQRPLWFIMVNFESVIHEKHTKCLWVAIMTLYVSNKRNVSC